MGRPSDAFCRLLGCRWPLQQAGMGAVTTPDLVAAVTRAGALGTLGAAGIPAAVLGAVLDGIDVAPVAVNFLMPFLDREAVATAAGRARLVEFFWAQPDRVLVEMVHAGGALAAWQVGSVDEARAAADSGCDLVIAQGVEAGGHVRGTEPLRTLLDQVLPAVVGVPVIAAGGIGTAADVAAVIDAGAAAARVGTRFVAAAEASAHPAYVDALVRSGADDTVLTTLFGRGWPDAPHRVLRGCVEAAERFDGDVVGQAPYGPIPRLAPTPPAAGFSGAVEAMAMYAGRSVGAVRRGGQPAAEIVAEMVSALPS